MLPTSRQTQTGWNQKVDDADSQLPINYQSITKQSEDYPRADHILLFEPLEKPPHYSL